MEIKILAHAPNIRASSEMPSPVVGYVQVSLGGKLTVWMTAMRSKKGYIFLSFPSVKIKGEWFPALAWPDKDMAREIGTQLKDEVKKIFDKAPDDSWVGGL